ncbi:hypothetical protein [Blastococcus sp. SYSU D00820]
MSALTFNCDPDMSTCGSPIGCGPEEAGGSGSGPGLRSTAVLLALVAVAVAAVTGSALPGFVTFAAGAVGAVSALVLCGRGVRLARRAAAAVPQLSLAVRRSRPVG